MMREPIFEAWVRMRGISEGWRPGYFGQARPGSFTSAVEVLISRPSPPQSTETLHHKNWLNVTQLLNFTDDHSGSGIQDWEVIWLFGSLSFVTVDWFINGSLIVLEAFDIYWCWLRKALLIWNTYLHIPLKHYLAYAGPNSLCYEYLKSLV